MTQIGLLSDQGVALHRVALSHTDKVVDVAYQRDLLDAGVIRAQESTVLVLTGSGLKASATVGDVLKLGARRA